MNQLLNTQLKNVERLPPEVVPVLKQHVGILKEVLGAKLVGVYVHGSAAMGGFNPRVSDLDYLALIDEPLTIVERASLAEKFLAVIDNVPFAKGVEMSIVLAKYAGTTGFAYPTPFEFHFGEREHIERHSYPHEREMLDPDLASYFAVIRDRGVSVIGADITEVFGSIDKKYYWWSVKNDIDDASDEVTRDPVYFILNLARTFYGLCDNAIYSKAEGATLFSKGDFTQDEKKLVADALDTYQHSTKPDFDPFILRSFVRKMLLRIEPYFKSLGI